MALLSESELTQMEAVLAHLLRDAADDGERTAILTIHSRLTRIFEQQSDLRASENRLTALTAQTSR